MGVWTGAMKSLGRTLPLKMCYQYWKNKTNFPQKNYTNPGYSLSLVDTLWNAGSYRQPLEQEGNPMT